MAKRPTVTTLASGFNSTETLNTNFEALRDGFDNTLSLDGSTPNAMEADLDLNGNNIIGAAGLLINGTDYLSDVEAAKAAALVAQAAAETAETNAETAETNAEASETAAGLSATAAATSASAAAASEAGVDADRVAAQAAATAASTSETNAAASETAAGTSETNAATSETNAATSATNAATSATESETAKVGAEAAKDAALAALDSFDDRYLGQKTSDPTVDNDGDPLVAGALYYNTTDDVMKVYDGSVWVAAYASLSGALLASNNLSDVTSASVSRTNLGLGTAATTASTDYATAAQGTTADAALPKAGGAMTGAITTTSTFDGRDVATDGTKLDGIEASADVTDTANVTSAGALMDSEVTNLAQVKAFDSADYATAAQGTLAASALQAASTLDASNLSGTAAAINGSAITNLTSGNLVGALPAIDGSALTSLTSANLTGALPAIDGSALTGVGVSTTYGAVGTYGLFYRASAGQNAPATTTAGSNLLPANTYTHSTTWGGYSGSGAPSGTWRLMGNTGYYNNIQVLSRVDMYTSVYVRIS